MQGLIFTVACDKGLMRLYDCRNYQIGPFQTFLVRQSPSLITELPGSLASPFNVCCDVVWHRLSNGTSNGLTRAAQTLLQAVLLLTHSLAAGRAGADKPYASGERHIL